VPEERFRKAFLLVLVVAISALFTVVIRDFLLTIFLAAIFAGLVRPLYLQFVDAFRGNRPLASALTVIVLLVLVMAPLLIVLGVVTNEAMRMSVGIRPGIEEVVARPSTLWQYLDRIPFIDRIEPYRAQIINKGSEAIAALGNFLVTSLSNTTRGTLSFLFQFFIFLYTLFFLLMDGPDMLRAALNYLPLRDSEKQQMLDRFVSVTRATLKGTLVIGVIQGTLSGFAFWIAGIQGAVFWGTVMMVLSILPVVGGALVWVPACIILAATGQWMKAVMLAAFCALVVGSVDNLLRPRLVGRDTRMHDLLILFSTLGGIIAFGPIGFIVGPIVAALFVTSWEIFGVAYRDVLPASTLMITPDTGRLPEQKVELETGPAA
jgi:predicted PurR-regulated permease PerM